MQINRQPGSTRHIRASWLTLAGALIAVSVLLRVFSTSFGYDADIADMPLLTFVGGYCLVGLAVFAVLPKLVRSSPEAAMPQLLVLVALAGLVMRLLQFGAEPVLEDDYNRYLWDGAVTASGLNPYSASPESVVSTTDPGATMSKLRTDASQVLERVNYPEYRTVYPPVAQVAFALSYWIKPFDLNAWRAVLLIAELASAAFIAAILIQLGRSPLWASLYWWNPIMIKEYANSAHMEPLVVLPVVAGLYLITRNRLVGSTAVLTIAAGAKLWPVLLTLPVFRQLWLKPRPMLISIIISAGLLAAFALPILTAGLSEDSGFVAYAQKWRASSASYLVGSWLSEFVAPASWSSGMAVRALLACGLGVVILISMRDINLKPEQLIQRLFWTAAALYLLSPSQFPWYFGWIVPFLCIFPVRGLLLASALLPLHYLYFYLDARDLKSFYVNGVVWLMWLPVWGLIAFDFWRSQRAAAFET